jgi:hypothetical protein
VPEPRPEADPNSRRQRSRELTREIAAVLREINAILAVPLYDRGDEWNARASAVQQRKAALIAAIEALAAEQADERDRYGSSRSRATRTTGPEVAP